MTAALPRVFCLILLSHIVQSYFGYLCIPLYLYHTDTALDFKEDWKYYTKVTNRSKVKIFQNSKAEGKGSIYSSVKGSVAAYSQQGLSLKIIFKDFFFPSLFLTFKGIRFQSLSI